MDKARGLTLSELMRELERDEANPSVEGASTTPLQILDVTQDSRKVSPGALFYVRAGKQTSGVEHVDDAKARGAVALLADSALAPALAGYGLPVIASTVPRSTLARVAAAVHHHPSFGIDVVGITGTNGKSTATHLFAQAYDAVFAGNNRCGLVGTLGAGFLGALVESPHTTPEVDDLQRELEGMCEQKAGAVAMEVSSIALAVGRVDCVHFRAAAWLNFTQDHLDFHGSMSAYENAKRELFLAHRPAQSVLVLDHPPIAALADELIARGDAVVGVSLANNTLTASDRPTFRVTQRELSALGTMLTIDAPGGPYTIASPLVGRHNVENLVTTLALAHALGYDTHAFAAALSNANGAPGRLERCDDAAAGDDITVLVDYSHTPDALANALTALRAFCTNRLACVFGAGGDRDATKRAPMGSVVAEGADWAIVTTDNPRSEAAATIAAAVVRGIEAGGMRKVVEGRDTKDPPRDKTFRLILDRAAAIERAVRDASGGDIVLIAGKGHETYQIVGNEKREFDDRVHARAALAARRARAAT